ncbi:hypothetical protein HG536_0A00730 [Torulaspora globosa]|uniref:DNA repair protein RAD2 n=1 Tax=Torulaspora globosa TaxID=48254 RepID=A0A7G3Z9S0_9SACH|nr:uncharacterized protein HG536_0A00730 [Torulaspora globosa]QLL30256.1 hypothetical protein HG536_0A00730 [Torulaspora globosa]
MGVHSLWDIVGPTAKPVRLESLQDRRMAVDASIWIYQFLKAVRDQEGNALKHSHIVGFFRRICKLLYFGIKPVFIFDGGVPTLKRRTIQQRKERRQGKRDNAEITARKLLAIQLQKKEGLVAEKSGTAEANRETTSQELFKPQDEWHLPVIPGFQYDEDDQRVVSAETFEKMVHSMDEELDNIDLDSINPASAEFDELPKSTQYLILSTLRLKSRLRMGYTKEQLEKLFPNSMDFSKFQIDMVKRRNFFTQKLMGVTGMHDGGSSKLTEEVAKRVSGQLNKEYKLTKSDSGWTLGLGDFDGSETQKAIVLDDKEVEAFNYIRSHGNVDNTAQSPKTDNKKGEGETDEEDGEDLEWEDVDVQPQNVQEREDYSIKAARLPNLEREPSSAGSQSFLDKRYDYVSPMKRPYTKVVRHVEDDIEEGEDEQEDEYKRQLDEIELIEATQRSKNALKQLTEQQQQGSKRQRADIDSSLSGFKQPKLKTPDQEKRDENGSGDRTPTFAFTSEQTLNDQAASTDSNDSSKDIVSSAATGFPLSENQQNLNHIISKIPDFNFGSEDSFLFQGTSKNDIRNAKEDEQAKEKKPIQKPPAWFENNQAPSNPFSASHFVQDRAYSTSHDPQTNGPFKLVSGADVLDLVQGAENHDDDVEELIDVGANVDVEEDHNLAAVEPGQPKNARKEERQALAFDYDFSEEEEDSLTENMKKEAEEFAMFQSSLSNKVVDKAFIEDELFEQQMKDKRDSDEVTGDMILEIQDLLSRFGIPFLTAPMEAEAQCAELLKLKLVDGIITDDSDVFLFGGTKIYKNMFQEKNYVEFYDEQSIMQNLGLDRERMIELAQLLGSDYTNGIKGMGPVSSMEVLAEFGTLIKFRDWYNQGQFDKEKQKTENSFEKNLRKKLIKNEVVLTAEFPSDLVREAYLRPEVDHDTTAFSWGTPDLDMLRDFMKVRIGWPQEKADEILVPLIRDINKRKKQARQMKLNEFFPSTYMEDKKLHLGKRITSATAKLKQRKIK